MPDPNHNPLSLDQRKRVSALNAARNALSRNSVFVGSSLDNSPNALIDVADYILTGKTTSRVEIMQLRELPAPDEDPITDPINVAEDFHADGGDDE